MKSKIETASLSWDANGVPLSLRFDDPYFSRDNGLEESTQVFLETNLLAERFAALGEHESFVVAETGFGTGLNFLLTWRCFNEYAPDTARLIYISIEGYPLRPTDLHKCLEQWPELKGLSTELENHYPALVPGHHWRLFSGRIGLHLIFDQIEPALQSLHPKITHHNFEQELPSVDSWFLDGFAPAKNPDMWQDSIYPSIARLSKAGTTLSSFTAAGAVRRNLQDWGFKVEKIPGFRGKREMINCEFDVDWQPTKDQIRAHATKHAQTWHLPDKNVSKPKAVSILGAGIAGLSLARSLAQRGISVTIYDRHANPLEGTSGNPQVAIFGRLSPDSGDLEDFVLQSLAYSADFYKPFWQSSCGNNSGLLQLARNPSEQEKMQRLVKLLPVDNGLVEYVKAEQSLKFSGLQLDSDGLWFGKSGWISPPKLAKEILSHELIQFKGGLDLDPSFKTDHWLLKDRQGKLVERCEILVICSGAEVLESSNFDWLPIKPVAGQVNLVTVSKTTQPLTTVISKSTSICPANEGEHCLGGSYRLGETALDIRKKDTEDNLNKIKDMLNFPNAKSEDNKGLNQPATFTEEPARTGVRATTPDYIPICGAAPDLDQLNRDFEPLRRDAKTPINRVAPAQKGLYLNVGYGSRGYAYAPQCAEHLASIICGDSSPLPNHLQRAVHPARFPIRNIIRGK